MNPALQRVLRAAALVAALVPTLACGLGDQIQQSAFETSCVSECVVSAERPVCQSYCQCAYRWAQDNGRMSELEGITGNERPMPPVMVDVMAACGSDLYDAAFNRGCTDTCAQTADRAQCERDCACMLRELRGPGPRPDSTRFLVQNLDSDPPTPAGQARMDAAQTVCTQP